MNVLSAATTVGLEMAEYTVSECDGSISVRVVMRGNSSDVITVIFNTISQTASGTCCFAIYKITYIALLLFLSLFYSTI